MLVIFGMMCYFNNFSIGAWVYLSLHGNYGLLWVLKDRVFPDPAFNRPMTFMSITLLFVLILVPYYYIAYLMISGGEEQKNPSFERVFVAI